MLKIVGPLMAVFVLALLPVQAEESVDLDMVTRIRDEGFRRSKVMKTLSHLTDAIGPRLTGSPQMKEANDWTRQKLEEWGLEKAHLEAYEFGRGWSFSYASVHMLQPRAVPLIALPKAWTPDTEGLVRGTTLRVEIESEDDFEKFRGKLAGKILFLDDSREIGEPQGPVVSRHSDERLSELVEFPIPGPRRNWRGRFMKRRKLRSALNEFLVEEKALATVEVSSKDGGLIRVGGGGSYTIGENPGVPGLVMAIEQYNQTLRFMKDKREVELEIDIRAQFHDQDTMAYNTVAEIPGKRGNAEVVMVGAHMDSWHGGTGATDNAAGCAVAMEAVRLLRVLDVRPLRTIRIALWSGEEQGLQGSRAYVDEHFASRPESEDEEQKKLPVFLREDQWPLTLKPGHAKLSAYFNLDNGGGKIRGIYAEENAAVKPIFDAWLEPLNDLGSETVTLRRTGGTDHTSFDRVGLPGFQFIQDRLDYNTRTHHTNMDVYDHLKREDLVQASVIMASFLYHTATREEMLPRKPVPKKPSEEEKAEESPDDDGDE